MVIPVLALAGGIAFWLKPHYLEEKSYYRSVFCTIDNNDQQFFLRDMESLVESGNSGYSLRQYHYIQEPGKKMFSTREVPSHQEKATVRDDPQQCLTIMNEKQRL